MLWDSDDEIDKTLWRQNDEDDEDDICSDIANCQNCGHSVTQVRLRLVYSGATVSDRRLVQHSAIFWHF